MSDIEHQSAQLIDVVRPLRRVIVAFSGGVDSSVVLAAAARAELDSLIAVTAHSPSVSTWQLELAQQIATEVGTEHRIIRTAETTRPEYIRNDGRRCFYCKQTLYQSLSAVAEVSGDHTICSGTNADDLGDYRPGIQAGSLAGVRTPLADLQIDKSAVRALAQHFGLSNADAPASPCLSSRIAYGVEVTVQRLRRIELAEAWLREHDFSDCRVRTLAGDRASVEVPLPELLRLQQPLLARELQRFLAALGFQDVTVDPHGLRSGNLNQALFRIESGRQVN
jgi:uncharacterized protein